MESVAVPQHLELEDVVVFGLGPTDLLCAAAGVATGWWLYLQIGDPLAVQLILSGPPVLVGLALGIGRLADRSLRHWAALVLGYHLRPRVLR
ncbi:MAG: hypothetical protein NVSMB8_06450 [Candidatus Limnocylindrales bacterium]